MFNPKLFRLATMAVAVGLASAACSDDDVIAPEPLTDDIVETAVAAGSFQTLVAAVQAADLVETLQGPGPFTVFAPNDAAFDKLPDGTIESLLMPENQDQLVSILTYHVVPGRLLAADVLASTTLTTVQGQSLTISLDGEIPNVNDAAIIATDIEATNGVIHVIDSVLLPN